MVRERKKRRADRSPRERELDRIMRDLKLQAERRRESRECGECTACCYALGVPATDDECERVGWTPPGKDAWEPCQHDALSDGPGCGIYEDRPECCRQFECGWLQGAGLLEDEDRPDKIGVIFAAWGDSGKKRVRGRALQAIQAFELWKGAAEGERAASIIEAMRRADHAVMVIRPKDRTLLTPLTIGGSDAWSEVAAEIKTIHDNKEA